MGRNHNFEPCPRCGIGYLFACGERQGGFSGGKAALGVFLVGPIGIAAGALGKKKKTYQCVKCGYTIED